MCIICLPKEFKTMKETIEPWKRTRNLETSEKISHGRKRSGAFVFEIFIEWPDQFPVCGLEWSKLG